MRVKVISKSKFKGVSLVKDRQGNEFWACKGEVNGLRFFSKHKNERDAAKSYDWKLIENSKMPVNLYKQV